jgi:hypothetical protein
MKLFRSLFFQHYDVNVISMILKNIQIKNYEILNKIQLSCLNELKQLKDPNNPYAHISLINKYGYETWISVIQKTRNK